MTKINVWDVPIRIFHWAFAVCLTAALVIAFTVKRHNPWFQLHMLLGMTAGFLLVVRLVIGICGARYSRLRGLFFRPVETIIYFKNAAVGRASRFVGHNPGTAFVSLIMFVLVVGSISTGLFMTSDFIEELHEFLAYGMIAAISVHLLGMLLHTIYHRENIAFSMVTGKKEGEINAEITSPQFLPGITTILVIVIWAGILFSSYDRSAGTVDLPGIGRVNLRKDKENNEGKHSSNNHEEDHDEHEERD